jgi:hypothetical protein
MGSSPKPWTLIPLPDDSDATQMVRASSYVRLGDDTRARFWTNKWLPDKPAIIDAYLLLASFVKDSAQGLCSNCWIKDIKGQAVHCRACPVPPPLG